ncbi:MerR family transcriptional regulator, partial [Saccharothrix sp. MB29]|nr:MerR family transcriptional regulator [Saccharothrix sp. MB29]
MTEVLLRIGELAARAGVSIRTVDYYTTLGLIDPAQRTAGGYRLYQPSDVDRIHLVQRLEVQGVPLE